MIKTDGSYYFTVDDLEAQVLQRRYLAKSFRQYSNALTYFHQQAEFLKSQGFILMLNEWVSLENPTCLPGRWAVKTTTATRDNANYRLTLYATIFEDLGGDLIEVGS